MVAIDTIQPNAFSSSILFDVSKHFFPYFFRMKKWLFVFCGENQMYPDSYPAHNLISDSYVAKANQFKSPFISSLKWTAIDLFNVILSSCFLATDFDFIHSSWF